MTAGADGREPGPGAAPGPGRPTGSGPEAGAWWRAADLAVRLAGGVVAFAGGLLVGVLVLVSVPWRLATWLGAVRLPFAVLVAVAGMLALLWFSPRATGARWTVLLPVAGWFVVAVAALGIGDPGGQLLVPDDWVAGVALFGGTVVAVVGAALALRPPGVEAARR